MGVSYDKKTKTWSVSYEKDDNPVSNTVSFSFVKTPAKYFYNILLTPEEKVTINFGLDDSSQTIKNKLTNAGYSIPSPQYNAYLWWTGNAQEPQIVQDIKAQQITQKSTNKINNDKNTIASQNNALYKKVYTSGTSLQKTKEPGNYLTYINAVKQLPGSDTTKKTVQLEFDNFYKNEIVSLWDQKNAAKVPFEGFENIIKFDPDYYGSTSIGKAAKEAWDKAEKEEDLDFLGRYGNYESYALWHYSNVGQNEAKKKGILDPGFKPLTPKDGFEYAKVEEVVPSKTDAELQSVRDKVVGGVLGLKPVEKPSTIKGQAPEQTYELNDVSTQYKNLVQPKDIQDKWKTAKNEILYAQKFPEETKQPWAKLYEAVKKDTGLEPDVNTEEGFGEFLVKANQLDPSKYSGIQKVLNEVKAIPDINKVTTKLSDYDVALTKVTGEAEAKQTQKAAAFQKEFLEDSRKALIKAKQLEQKFDLLSGTSFGQEILSLRSNIANSILQESGIGGILAMGGKKTETLTEKMNLSLDTGKAFGSNNGMLYNWEKWFFDEIEKKYSGGLDVPNDYVPLYQRTEKNGYVSEQKIKDWKQYDEAYEKLKKNPNDSAANLLIKSVPKDYIAADKRKTTKKEWLDYEAERKKMGWVDNETLAKWSDYDDAYKTINNKNATAEEKAKAEEVYKKRPADYIEPGKRIDDDVKFAQDFFNDYLMPRFNTSKSISEFRDYINVDKDKQNIFQTEDRLNTLKNAAQASSVAWMKSLDQLKPSKFNSDYYFDPAGYYQKKGVGGEEDSPVLLGSHFQKEWGAELPKQYVDQKQDVEKAWEAAKSGLTTKDANGNDINWGANAYMYGFDINNKEDFAKLHYELVGKAKEYDSAPDVFNPKIAQIYLKQVLTPYIADKYAQIGTVFGQFVNPEDYANELVNNLDPLKNKEQIDKLLKLYGLDSGTDDLSQLKTLIADSIKSGTALDIRNQIKELNQAGEIPTQELLGVEYIQKEGDIKDEEITSDDALFNKFKSAGYKGTEEDFYAEFMPDATEEDKEMFKSLYAGKSLTDKYSFKPSGDPFSDLAQLEELSSFGEDQETLAQKKVKKEAAAPKSKYFSFFPDEEEPEEEPSSPVKIKKGSDILAEFKSKLKVPSASKGGFDFDNPFDTGFFGGF